MDMILGMRTQLLGQLRAIGQFHFHFVFTYKPSVFISMYNRVPSNSSKPMISTKTEFKSVCLFSRFRASAWRKWYPRCEPELWELGHGEGGSGGRHVPKPGAREPGDLPALQLQGEEGPLPPLIHPQPVPAQGGLEKTKCLKYAIMSLTFWGI